ncbi:MAG TPA: hypothetical protein VHX43_19355 [Xanthobacteraceae bacterium]|nr:hypothetical protein [Xanthobacteraceae bacterium]
MRRCKSAAVLLVMVLASAQLAWAQSSLLDRAVKAAPGQIMRVGIYTDIRPDCTSGPLPAIRLARPPAHGTVSVKRGMLKATNIKQCLAIDVPAFVAFYRAAADFSGADEFELEITFTGGRKQIQRFQVSAAGAASGQGKDQTNGQGI